MIKNRNMKMSEYIKQLQERLKEYGDADVILEERERAPYIRNISYGGKVFYFEMY